MTMPNHTAALIATLTKPKAQARTVATTGACRAKTPCGGRCCLDASIRHDLHICNEPDCLCHSRERYERQDAGSGVHRDQ